MVHVPNNLTEQALSAARHAPTPAEEWEKAKLLVASLRGTGDNPDEARGKLQRALHDLIVEITVSPKPIPSYRTNDGISLKLGGPGKRIPRFPICHIILKSDKVLLTGETPSAAWQAEVMGLELPETPRHLRAKVKKTHEALTAEGPAPLDPTTSALMDSLRTVFKDEHQLIAESKDEA